MSYIISKPWGGHCGIGHQFQNWLVGYILANHYGLTFVHSPFCGNVIEPQIDVPVKQWEEFLGFGRGFITESQLPSNIEHVTLPYIPWDESSWYNVTCDHPIWKNIIERHKNENVLFECAKDQFIVLDWDKMDTKTLKDNYWHMRLSDPRMVSAFEYNKMNVVIHVRRGDVTEHGRYKVRWVSDEVYRNVMDKMRKPFPNVLFHIYSDGLEKDLSGLSGDDVVLHAQENIFSTFHHMVCADILMPGQSAFSVLAGHLCDGIILARPWSPIWNNFPLGDRFVLVDERGNLQRDLD